MAWSGSPAGPIPGVDEAVARLAARVCGSSSPPTTRRRRGPSCTASWPTAASRRTTPTSSARPTWPPACSPRARPPLVLGDDGVVEALAARGVDRGARGAGRRRRGRPHPDLHLRQRGPGRRRRAGRGAGSSAPTRTRPSPPPTGWCPEPAPSWPPSPPPPARQPEVAGKPHRPTADAITARSPTGELRAMVGDRPSTDGGWPPSWASPSPWSSPGSPGPVRPRRRRRRRRGAGPPRPRPASALDGGQG